MATVQSDSRKIKTNIRNSASVILFINTYIFHFSPVFKKIYRQSDIKENLKMTTNIPFEPFLTKSIPEVILSADENVRKDKVIIREIINDNYPDKMSVVFDVIRLPKKSFIHIFSDDFSENYYYTESDFYTDNGCADFECILMSSGKFFIRIVYYDRVQGLIKYSSLRHYQSYNTRSIIHNTFKQAVCYIEINDFFYQKGLSVMKANSGSGWNIAGGPYVVTNHHVAEDVGSKQHLLTYNYESPTCTPENPAENSLRLRTKGVVATGGGSSSSANGDWSLYEVDKLTWEEAGIVPLFGALSMEIKENNELKNMPVFMAQHPWGAVKRIASFDGDGEPCVVVSATNDVIRYNLDSDGGSSGSPVLSQKTGGVIAEHYAGGGASNVGVNIKKVYNGIKHILPSSNDPKEAVIGLGKVLTRSIECIPHMEKFINIPTDEDFVLKSTLKDSAGRFYKNGNDYIFIAKFNTPDGETDSIVFEMRIEHSKIYLLKVYLPNQKLFNADSLLFSGWMSFHVNSEKDDSNLFNLIIPFTYEDYDPFTVPFEPTQTVTVTTDSPATTSAITHNSNIGFVAVRTGQGPLILNSKTSTSYTVLTVQVKDEIGNIDIVYLRGQRKTRCTPNLRPMNDYTGCGSSAIPAQLIVSYHGEDNADLPGGHWLGLLPIMANRNDFNEPILVNIDILKK